MALSTISCTPGSRPAPEEAPRDGHCCWQPRTVRAAGAPVDHSAAGPRPGVGQVDQAPHPAVDLVGSGQHRGRHGRAGALFCARYGIGGINPTGRAGFDPAAYSLSGFFLAQLAVGVLGVLAITGEYQTGSIQATLAATPQRQAVLAAKAVVAGAVTALVGIAASLAAFLVDQAILAHKGLQAHLGDPRVARAVLGAGLYLAALALLALGVGTLVRSTVGATAVVVGLVFILPASPAPSPPPGRRRSLRICHPTPARRSSAAPSSPPRASICSPHGWGLPSCAPTRPLPWSPPRWSCVGRTPSI